MSVTRTCPGLFITATDTEVGKTVVTCGLAVLLRRAGLRVGVCKPIATGCRHDREGLVSPDAEALAHFADVDAPLDIVNPVRYAPPLAPAVAAERAGQPVRFNDIDHALRLLDSRHDVLLVEGVGGLLVPLDERRTVLDLAAHVGYPVVVVTRSTLGTLNHTAMTCRLIRDAGLTLAGLVVNRYHPDSPDLAEADNPRWLAKQNRTSVLATIPEVPGVDVAKAMLPDDVVDALAKVDWLAVCRNAR